VNDGKKPNLFVIVIIIMVTLLETLDFLADFHAEFGDKFEANVFPADFSKYLHSQVIPSWVIVLETKLSYGKFPW